MELFDCFECQMQCFFPSRRRGAWATKGAQRFSCANVEAKKQTGHWSTGKCPVSCLLCSGNCSMTAHISLPRPPLLALLSNQPVCSVTFLVASVFLPALCPSFLSSILTLVHTLSRNQEIFYLFVLWDC